MTCNSSSAKLTTTNFSCNAPLSAGVNSITVTATDSAGDTQTAAISVTLGMSGPISIQVTPPNADMLVGGTQAFTAVDGRGVRRPDATWTVSDSTIASFVNGSPNTLVANAVGQVTLTATVGGVSAQTTVTVLSGTSLPVGTVLWSATPVAGYTTQQIVQAVPTADGPDLYSIEADSNGDILVRALKSDGEQLWQSSPKAYNNYFVGGVGDDAGGIVVEAQDLTTGSSTLLDIDRATGIQKWQYSVASFYDGLDKDVAIGQDGSIYIVETDEPTDSFYGSASYLDKVNPSSGALVSRVPLPASSFSDVSTCGDGYAETFAGGAGAPMVAPDGSVYLEVESSQQTETTSSPCDTSVLTGFSEALSLLRVLPDGGTQTRTLATHTLADWSDWANYPANPPGLSPGDVVPDGQGGVLASWVNAPQAYFYPSPLPTIIADVGTQSTAAATFADLDTVADSALDNNLVLGDNNTAFATDTGDRESVGTLTSVTVNFKKLNTPSGLSVGDTLSYNTNTYVPLTGNTGQTCSTTPGGPLDCPSPRAWPWNIEVAAVVSDDASNWYPIQLLSTKYTGQYKDSQGSVHPFYKPPVTPYHTDGPTSSAWQANRGTHSVFYVDEPGPLYYYDAPFNEERVDSANAIFNLVTAICNHAVCYLKDWYVQIVIDPGSMLDVPQSNAGLGHIAFN